MKMLENTMKDITRREQKSYWKRQTDYWLVVDTHESWNVQNELTTVMMFCNSRFLKLFKKIYIYTGCPRRNVRDFGRVSLMLNYTDITQNTYIQSWTVMEIMAREKCGHLAFPHTVRLQLCSALTLREQCGTHFCDCTSSAQRDKIAFHYCRYVQCLVTLRDNRDMSASVFVVQFNGFMSLTSYFDVKYRY